MDIVGFQLSAEVLIALKVVANKQKEEELLQKMRDYFCRGDAESGSDSDSDELGEEGYE